MAIQRKILSISLPPKMDAEIKKIAKKEEMTQSEIIREALREYLRQRQKKR